MSSVLGVFERVMGVRWVRWGVSLGRWTVLRSSVYGILIIFLIGGKEWKRDENVSHFGKLH